MRNIIVISVLFSLPILIAGHIDEAVVDEGSVGKPILNHSQHYGHHEQQQPQQLPQHIAHHQKSEQRRRSHSARNEINRNLVTDNKNNGTASVAEPQFLRRRGGGGRYAAAGGAASERGEWTSVLRAAAVGGGGGGSGAVGADRHANAKCVDIPANFTLCHGIQYTSMRLPNLLDHETLKEAIQQSDAWNSLLRLHCHPDTKLYLCSLFAPICLPNLDKHLYPCQSLCLAVQQGCEGRMMQYGFPWPEMLRCRFPPDNDMCIKPATGEPQPQRDVTCKSCAQVPTFENIMDNYCRSNIVMKVRLKSANTTHITVTKTRAFKNAEFRLQNLSTELTIRLAQASESAACTCQMLRAANADARANAKSRNFLLMAGDGGGAAAKRGGRSREAADAPRELLAGLIVPWRQKDKSFKRAIRKFRKVNCNTLGREIRESVLRQNFKRTIY